MKKLRCSYCNRLFDTNLDRCPSCGSIDIKVEDVSNEGVTQIININGVDKEEVSDIVSDLSVTTKKRRLVSKQKKKGKLTIPLVFFFIFLFIVAFGVLGNILASVSNPSYNYSYDYDNTETKILGFAEADSLIEGFGDDYRLDSIDANFIVNAKVKKNGGTLNIDSITYSTYGLKSTAYLSLYLHSDGKMDVSDCSIYLVADKMKIAVREDDYFSYVDGISSFTDVCNTAFNDRCSAIVTTVGFFDFTGLIVEIGDEEYEFEFQNDVDYTIKYYSRTK